MGVFKNIIKGVGGTLTHPWRNWDPAANALHIVAGPKKQFQDTPFLNLLKEYEQKDAAAQQKVFSTYQHGEDAALARNKAAGQSAVASADQSLIGRGLYNTTQRNVEENRARAGEDAGRTAIAGGRAALLGSTRPDPSVYGPLIAGITANPNGTTDESKRAIASIEANDQVITQAATDAYTGKSDSALSRLYSSVADEAKGGYSPLGKVGTATAGRLAANRGQVGRASIYGASQGTEEAKRPNPGIYGPIIAQLANTPVQQNQFRQIAGKLAPVAGAVVGGFYGGPAGAVAGGAIGGYAGEQFGGASYGPYAGHGPNGTLAGLSTGMGMAGNFVRPGANGSPNYFGELGQSAPLYSAPRQARGDYEFNYAGSPGYGGGRVIT